ncbi:hypothetical protein EMPS_05847 [Entomortierella parvispora]|uniref:Uncharacterized protein n=1 Tax=Entomortierella parvispora TaxID=205924 RepID=A0A9P3HB76_9FUNG|nr:hypothetical protein EMPS_05847 [Entomortierella parvispora]
MPTATQTKAATATTAATTSAPAPAQTTTTGPVFNIPGYGGQSQPTGSGSPVFNLPSGGPYIYPSMPAGTGPNDPNYNAGGSSSGSTSNLGMIIGITVAGVAVLAIAGLLIQRYRSHSRTSTLNSHQTRSRTKHNQTGVSNGNGNLSGGEEEARGDKAKLAKSFTIRKPPSVYVEDDGDLDQTGHPRYKSDGDARNHPYYGDRTPGLVEYELSDTSGQKYGPSSVAERKRYVEQQQRKVMDEYEMFNPHKDKPPMSPYPPSQMTSAPSYTSGPLSPTMAPAMTPSMGGRSPRVPHPNQQPMPSSSSGTQSPFGRPMQQQNDDYRY